MWELNGRLGSLAGWGQVSQASPRPHLPFTRAPFPAHSKPPHNMTFGFCQRQSMNTSVENCCLTTLVYTKKVFTEFSELKTQY